MSETPEGQLDYSNVGPQSNDKPAGQETGSSLLSYPTMPDGQQAITDLESQNSSKQELDDNAQENQQLADAGEFEKLAEKVNSDLTKIDMQGDEGSAKTIECLRVIANDGLPEHRLWASGMLNWHNKMLNWRNEMAIYVKRLGY